MRKKYVNKKGTGICSGKEKKKTRERKRREEKKEEIQEKQNIKK